jgi:hypothetical protein
MYAGNSERIVDIGIAYDTFLSPSLTIHTRIDEDQGLETGAVFVPAVEYAFDISSVTIALPLAVGFVTDDYYVEDEGGFAYVTVGAQASVPLSFIGSQYGDWTFNAGGAYWHSDEDSVGNEDDDIFAANFGIAVGF